MTAYFGGLGFALAEQSRAEHCLAAQTPVGTGRVGTGAIMIMSDHLGTPNSPSKESEDGAREAGRSAFRSMLLVFAVGFGALAVVAFIATGEVGPVLLVVFGFLGIAVFGWFGQRWLLRNMGEG
jgi:hypothetical protein